VALATAGLLGAAGAARAAGPTGTCDTPTGDITTSPFRVHASITASASNAPLTSVVLRILDPTTGAQVTSDSWSPNAHSFTIDKQYSISSNGRYHLLISAQEDDGVLAGTQSSTPIDRFFSLDVPPAAPANVKAAVDASRNVTISWDANTEPDLLGYYVERATGTDTTWTRFPDEVNEPAHQYVDKTSAGTPGDYRYRVFAVRKSSDPNAAVQSDPSSEAKATVPSAAAAGGTGSGTGSGSGSTSGAAGGPLTVTNSPGTPDNTKPAPALAKAGKVDLSSFSALLDKARKPQGQAEAPDPGFKPTLPFKPGEAASEDGTGEQTLGSGAGESTHIAGIDVRTALPFVAGSLLLTVLLMHVMFVKSEIRRVDALEALEPADDLEVPDALPDSIDVPAPV
jgi:hypothetical protein